MTLIGGRVYAERQGGAPVTHIIIATFQYLQFKKAHLYFLETNVREENCLLSDTGFHFLILATFPTLFGV